MAVDRDLWYKNFERGPGGPAPACCLPLWGREGVTLPVPQRETRTISPEQEKRCREDRPRAAVPHRISPSHPRHADDTGESRHPPRGECSGREFRSGRSGAGTAIDPGAPAPAIPGNAGNSLRTSPPLRLSPDWRDLRWRTQNCKAPAHGKMADVSRIGRKVEKKILRESPHNKDKPDKPDDHGSRDSG